MSEIVEHDRVIPSWRDHYEEQVTRRFERQKREDAKERALVEQRKQEARKAEAEAASTNWYAAVDGRIHEHLKSWLWTAIDQRVTQILEQHFFSGERGVGGAVIGGLTDAIGGIVGKLKRTIEEQQRAFEAKLAALEERQALSNEAHQRDVAGGAQERAHLCEELKCALTEMADAFGGQIAALEQRLKAVPGKLPVAKTWRPESVSYQAEFVAHEGSLYQAKTDTAQAPGGSDWVCVARAGCDGQSVRVRGAFNATANYKRFDIVSLDGTAFIARRDNPGVPGISEDGWQLMSRAGTRGPVGEVGPRGRKGERGARGEDGREIVSWHLERATYRAFPVYADGRMEPELNLRGLFEQFVEETSRAVE